MSVLALAIFLSLAKSASSNYYYTAGSPIVNSNSCPIATCSQCTTGNFNLNCGMDANHVNPDNCQPCTGLPANAAWQPWGEYPDGIGASASICTWECNYRYYKSGSTCVRGACSATVVNSELAPGTDYPECETRCKAGYSGNAALNPTTCTGCSMGYYAEAGATTCSPCAAGQYLNTTLGKASTDCKPCETHTYATSQGTANCSPCQLCATGQWRSGCGVSSAGTCQGCTNSPV